jgi:mono/diheme cytochrome c family protein
MLLAAILLVIAAGLYAVIYSRKDHRQIINCTGSPVQYTNNEGRKLFQENCASCHHPLKEQTGPALQGLEKRFPMELLHEFIREPDKAVKKSKYLRDLEIKYGIKHVPFPSLTDEQINSIFGYSHKSTGPVS